MITILLNWGEELALCVLVVCGVCELFVLPGVLSSVLCVSLGTCRRCPQLSRKQGGGLGLDALQAFSIFLKTAPETPLELLIVSLEPPLHLTLGGPLLPAFLTVAFLVLLLL